MAFVFQIIETQAQPVLAVRTVTSIKNLPNELGKAFGSIAAYLAEKGEEPLGPAFTAYYNMDMEKLDVEIGFPVAKEVAGKGEIISTHIPAGKKATGFHKGSYSGISATYEALTKWISDQGRAPAGVVYEYYFNAPTEVPESELLTKIESCLNDISVTPSGEFDWHGHLRAGT